MLKGDAGDATGGGGGGRQRSKSTSFVVAATSALDNDSTKGDAAGIVCSDTDLDSILTLQQQEPHRLLLHPGSCFERSARKRMSLPKNLNNKFAVRDFLQQEATGNIMNREALFEQRMRRISTGSMAAAAEDVPTTPSSSSSPRRRPSWSRPASVAAGVKERIRKRSLNLTTQHNHEQQQQEQQQQQSPLKWGDSGAGPEVDAGLIGTVIEELLREKQEEAEQQQVHLQQGEQDAVGRRRFSNAEDSRRRQQQQQQQQSDHQKHKKRCSLVLDRRRHRHRDSSSASPTLQPPPPPSASSSSDSSSTHPLAASNLPRNNLARRTRSVDVTATNFGQDRKKWLIVDEVDLHHSRPRKLSLRPTTNVAAGRRVAQSPKSGAKREEKAPRKGGQGEEIVEALAEMAL